MKRLLFYGNCQLQGMDAFFKACGGFESFNTSVVETWAMDLKITSEEHAMAEAAAADIIVFHEWSLRPLETLQPNPAAQIIPMSVVYNSGTFIFSADPEDWAPVLEYEMAHGTEEAIRHAVFEADMGYKRRRDANLERMKEKEDNDKVPQELRISDLFNQDKEIRMMLTSNHPSSFIYYHWANRLLNYLSLPQLPESLLAQCLKDDNIAGLPCVFGVSPGATNHLGLSYGGGETDIRDCINITRERLANKGQGGF